MAKNRWQTTVRVFPSHNLGNQKGSFFEALAALANLQNDIAEYDKLKLKYPNIWPVEIRDGPDEVLRWDPEAFTLLRFYRDLLRCVWDWPYDPASHYERNRKREALQILMGISSFETMGISNFERMLTKQDFPPGTPSSEYQSAWREIRSNIAGAIPGSAGWAFPSWPSGQFVYVPANPFQEALYLLFRESWRARICRSCQKFFVADKQQRQYCSSVCAGEAKKHHDLEWWHRTHGKVARSQKKRGKL